MWYWVCEGYEGTGKVAFKVIKCLKNKQEAEKIVIKKEKEKNKNTYWVREDEEHSDQDYKQYKCPECKNKMSSRQLDDTWDWAGPHCNKCGCTGMVMFAEVTKKKPIISGYQHLKNKFASILGWDVVEELERKN